MTELPLDLPFDPDEIEDAFRGLPCGGATDSGAGSLLISFGHRIPLARAIKNPHLTEVDRQFRYSHTVLTVGEWSAESGDGVDLVAPDDSPYLPLGSDATVTAFRIDPPLFDLAITLSSGARILVRNGDDPDDDETYHVQIDSIYWSVGPGRVPSASTIDG